MKAIAALELRQTLQRIVDTTLNRRGDGEVPELHGIVLLIFAPGNAAVGQTIHHGLDLYLDLGALLCLCRHVHAQIAEQRQQRDDGLLQFVRLSDRSLSFDTTCGRDWRLPQCPPQYGRSIVFDTRTFVPYHIAIDSRYASSSHRSMSAYSYI